jgi:hypothetical protein
MKILLQHFWYACYSVELLVEGAFLALAKKEKNGFRVFILNAAK